MKNTNIAVIIFLCLFFIQKNIYANNSKNYTVINFYQQAGAPEFNWLSKALADLFIDSLKNAEIGNIVDRENMQTIIKELELIDKGLIEPSNLKKVGGLMKVTDIIYGFYKINNNKIEINIFVLNLASEEIIRSANISGDYNNLIEVINNLSDKFLLELAEANIIKNIILPFREKKETDIFLLKNYYEAVDLLDNGMMLEAMKICMELNEKSPDFIKALIMLSNIYKFLGEYEHSLICLNKIITDFSKYYDIKQIYLNAGDLLRNYISDLTREKNIYLLYLDKYGDDIEILKWLIKCQIALDDLPAAWYLYKKIFYLTNDEFEQIVIQMHRINAEYHQKTGRYINKEFGMVKVKNNNNIFNFEFSIEYYKNLVKKHPDFFKGKNIFANSNLENIQYKISDIDCIFVAEDGYLIKSVDIEIVLDKNKLESVNKQIGYIGNYFTNDEEFEILWANRASPKIIKQTFILPESLEILILPIFTKSVASAELKFNLIKTDINFPNHLKKTNDNIDKRNHNLIFDSFYLPFDAQNKFVFFRQFNEPLSYGVFRKQILKYLNLKTNTIEIFPFNFPITNFNPVLLKTEDNNLMLFWVSEIEGFYKIFSSVLNSKNNRWSFPQTHSILNSYYNNERSVYSAYYSKKFGYIFAIFDNDKINIFHSQNAANWKFIDKFNLQKEIVNINFYEDNNGNLCLLSCAAEKIIQIKTADLKYWSESQTLIENLQISHTFKFKNNIFFITHKNMLFSYLKFDLNNHLTPIIPIVNAKFNMNNQIINLNFHYWEQCRIYYWLNPEILLENENKIENINIPEYYVRKLFKNSDENIAHNSYQDPPLKVFKVNNDIWFAGEWSFIDKFDKVENTYKRFPLPVDWINYNENYHKNNFIRCSDKFIWFGIERDGLFVFNIVEEKWSRIISVKNNKSAQLLNAHYDLKKSLLFALTYNELFLIKNNKIIKKTKLNKFAENFFIIDDLIFIKRKKNIDCYDNELNYINKNKLSKLQKIIYDILKDSVTFVKNYENYIFFGLEDKGMIILDILNEKRLDVNECFNNHSEKLSNQKIKDLLIDKKNIVLAANDKIYYCTRQTDSFNFTMEELFTLNNIYSEVSMEIANDSIFLIFNKNIFKIKIIGK